MYSNLNEILSCFGVLQVSKSLVVSGPLWTGPLHDTAYITEMLSLAEEWGWAGIETGTDLDKLLNQMVAESDPRLPFGYTKLDEVLTEKKITTLLCPKVVNLGK